MNDELLDVFELAQKTCLPCVNLKAGRVLQANSAFQRIHPFTSAEIEGRNFSSFFKETATLSGDIRRARPKPGVYTFIKNGEQVLVDFLATRNFLTSPQVAFVIPVNVGSKINAGYIETETLKGDLVSLIEHEIRNPLAIAQGYLQVALDTGDIGHVERAMTALDRIKHIFSGVREYAHQEEDVETELDLCLADPAVVIGDAVADIRMKFGVADMVFVDRADEGITNWDVERVTQLLYCLLDNATKYSPKGSTISILGVLDDPTQSYTIQIADKGIGMTKADIKVAFTPFRRGKQASKYAGKGIGLAVARDIVKSHNGDIQIHSKGRNKGTTVVVTLPLSLENRANGT